MTHKNPHSSHFYDDSDMKGLIANESPTPQVLNRGYLKNLDSINRLDHGLAYNYRSSATITNRKTIFYAQLASDMMCEIGGKKFNTIGVPRFIKDNQYRGFYSDSKSVKLLGNTGDFTKSDIIKKEETNDQGNPVSVGTLSKALVRVTSEGTRISNTLLGGSIAECDLTIVIGPEVQVPGSVEDTHYMFSLHLNSLYAFNDERYTLTYFMCDAEGASVVGLEEMTYSIPNNTTSGLVTLAGTYSTGSADPIPAYIGVKVSYKTASVMMDINLIEASLTVGDLPGIFPGGEGDGYGAALGSIGELSGTEWTTSVKVSLPETFVEGVLGYREILHFAGEQDQSLAYGIYLGIENNKEIIGYFERTENGSMYYPFYDFSPAEYVESLLRPFLFAIKWYPEDNTLGVYVGIPTGVGAEYTINPTKDFKNKDFKCIIGGDTGGLFTQFRYDAEWFSDSQLMGIHLANRRYINGLTMITSAEDVAALSRETLSNLLVNPDGRLYLNHWSGWPMETVTSNGYEYQRPDPSKVEVTEGPKGTGISFHVKPQPTSSSMTIVSDPMMVSGMNTYSFQATVGLLEILSGSVSLSVRFFSTTSTSSSVGSATYTEITKGEPGTFLAFTGAIPAAAVYARIILNMGNVVGADFYLTKMKFENSATPTTFTDTAGLKYAIYR